MKYQSANGCFFYYDRVLYSWRFAEPSMLFLLGLESVTTYDRALTDSIQISRYVYSEEDGSLEPMEELHKVYDKIYTYLSEFGSVEDFDSYIRFNCYGLKLLMNELTGTEYNRTVPIIFLNDINKKLIDLTKYMHRVPKDQWNTMSLLDRQAQKIYDIFEDAGFYKSVTADKRSYTLPGIYDREAIKEYNQTSRDAIKERNRNGHIYKLLDYKSMYSYSLGVLYGCKCLGYSDSVIWRSDPINWYEDQYMNLVRTAWTVFRFHWARVIPELKNDADLIQRYKGIQLNHIWNFDNTSSDSFKAIESDERSCVASYVTYKVEDEDLGLLSGELHLQDIIYSFNKKNVECSNIYCQNGMYLDFTDSSVGEWKNVNDLISSESPLKGVASTEYDDIVVRYLATTTVYLFKACKKSLSLEEPEVPNNYLSPDSDHTYFVSKGYLGWVNFNESVYSRETEDSPNILTLYPTTPTSLDHAISKLNRSVISYYECSVQNTLNTDEQRKLFGILDYYLADEQIKSKFTEFDRVLADEIFYTNYTVASDVVPEGYTVWDCYDLDTQIQIYANEDRTTLWDGTDNEQSTFPIDDYGYTSTPSTAINAFYVEEPYFVMPYNLRYNSQKQKFWSNEDDEYWYTLPSSDPEAEQEISEVRQWKKDIPDRVKIKSGELNLYRNIVQLNEDPIPRYVSSVRSDDKKYYIVNVEEIEYLSTLPNDKFIPVIEKDDQSSEYAESPYSLGITPYRCRVIDKDDDGNSLLDENGNPMVWYDSREKKYWNGLPLVLKWQDEKPRLRNAKMYDSLANQLISIIDNEEDELISIEEGVFITYEEFYANPNYGVIRDTLKAFSPDHQSDGIVDCYCDNKGKDDQPEISIYCIPGKTHWVAREALLNEYGYWIVDGTTSLYDGSNKIDVVYDDDHRD